MKRILALLLSISIMLSVCAPTALAVGEDMADGTQQEQSLRPELPEADENTEPEQMVASEENIETQEDTSSGTVTEGITWSLVDGVLTVTGTGAMPDYDDATYAPWYSLQDSITSVVIGEGITHVGDFSFQTYNLDSVQLPEGLLTVGDDAFVDYTGTELILPSTLQDAGDGAFSFAPYIQDLFIPAAFTGDISSAFSNCSTLMEIGVDENNPVYTAVDGMVLSKDGTVLELVPSGQREVVIPDGVTTIGEYALWGSMVKTIEVPDSVQELQSCAFYVCQNLTSIELPEGITFLPDYCFAYCSWMTEITLPSTLTEADFSAFFNCLRLETINFRGTMEQWNAITWGSDNEYARNCGTVICSDGTISDGGSTGDGSDSGESGSEGGESSETEKTSYPVTFIMGTDEITIEFYENMPLSTGGVGGSTVPAGDNILGWYLDGDYTMPWDVDNDLVTGSLRLYAKMADAYTWEYDATTYTLTISGTGMVQLENNSTSNTPWASYVSQIKNIVVEEGITGLGMFLFKNHSALQTVSLPDTLEVISKEAFWNCGQLQAVEIPASVDEIGMYPFEQTDAEITIDENNPYLEIKGGSIVTKDNGGFYDPELINILPTTSGEYTVPAGVRSIGEYSFAKNEKITEITVPETVYFIWDGAFTDMPNLEEAYVLAKVEWLRSGAFYNCWNLKKVVLSDTITRIGSRAFDGCHEDLVIYYMGSEEQWNNITFDAAIPSTAEVVFNYEYVAPTEGSLTSAIDWSLADGVLTISGSGDMPDFEYYDDYVDGNILLTDAPWLSHRNDITKVVIGEGITRLGAYSFSGYENITEMVLPEGLLSIGGNAMNNIWAVELILPSTLQTLDDEALHGLWNVTKLEIPASVTHIGSSALAYMQSATEYTVAEGNTHYKAVDGVLYDITGKTLVSYPHNGPRTFDIPEGVETIADGAFWGAWRHTFTLPSTLKTIGNYAFATCSGITQIEIPEGVTTIGDRAFTSCRNMHTIILPASLESIGDYAFNQCRALQTVKYRGSQQQWQNISIGDNNTGLENDGLEIIYNYVVYEGTAGENAQWLYDGSIKTLTISGTGPMADYATYTEQPWYDQQQLIEHVVVEEGITHLGAYAFTDFTFCDDISLPSTLTSIGRYALAGWSTKSFAIPDSVSYIAPEAFALSVIDKLEIPAAMTTISDDCLDGAAIRLLYVPKTVKAYGNSVFDLDTQVQFLIYEGSRAEYDQITTGTDNDGQEKLCYLFNGQTTYTGDCGTDCTYVYDLETLALTIRGTGAMDDFDYTLDTANEYNYPAPWEYLDVVKVTISKGVTAIGDYAFHNKNIDTLVLNKTVTAIGAYAFGDSGSVETVKYTGTQDQWAAITAEDGNSWMNTATVECEYSPVISGTADGFDWIIEDGALTIGGTGEFAPETLPWAGEDVDLSTVTLNEGVTAADISFVNGTDGVVLNLPATLEEISMGDAQATAMEIWYNGSLEDWLAVEKTQTSSEGLKTAVLNYVPEAQRFALSAQDADWATVTMFGLNAYFTVDGDTAYIAGTGTAGCGTVSSTWDSGIAHVVIGGDISEIADEAFCNYANIETIEITAPVKVYGDCAFAFMDSLAEIKMPATATKVGAALFKGSEQLTEVVLPNGIKELGYATFMFCYNLEKVYIPATVKSYAGDQFTETFNLQDVFFGGTEKQWKAMKYTSDVGAEFGWSFATEPEIHFSAKQGLNSVTVRNAENEKITALDVNIYSGTVATVVKAELNGLGEYTDEIIVSTDNDSVATITETGNKGEYIVYTDGEGTAKITFAAADNSNIKTVLTVKVTQMADSAQVVLGKTAYDDGRYIMIAGTTLTPEIKWLNGAAWPEYRFEINGDTAVAEIDENGKLVAKQAGTVMVTLIATGEDGHEMQCDTPLVVYNEKTKSILLTPKTLVIDPGYLPPARTVSGYIWAEPENDACRDYAITYTSSATLVPVEIHNSGIRFEALSNDKAKVTVTFKALDGSGKTAKATVQTGVAVRNIDITLPGANNGEQTVTVGKSFKATASVVPSTATVKTLNWYAVDEEGNPSDVVSVKNGTVKALKAGEALVIVESTDGNYAINSFKVVVTEKPAAKVVINEGEKTAVITRHHDGYVEFTPAITVLGADNTTDGVSQDVKITVAGTNGKYVEKWQDDDGQWYFSVNRAGKYTVKATTTDGTNKSATITVDVQQHVIDMQPTAPKGVTVVDESTWAVNVGTAFTPTAVYNFGEKLLAPTAAAKKFTVSLDPDTAAHSPYEIGVALEDCITISGTKITAKVRGVYRLLFTPVSVCEECAAETKAITLKVLYKNSTDLTNVTVRTNKGVIDEDNTLYLRTGVQAQLIAMINGVKANTKKVELYWKATDVRTGETQYKVLDNYTGKLNLTGVEPGTELEIKCFAYDIYDKYNDNSDIPATIRVVVTEKLTKNDISLVEVLDSDNMVPVTEQSYTLSYGDIYAVVSRLDGNFTFKSSNAKIVSIVEGYDLAGFETLLRPTGTGTATITVTANDGSGVKNTFKVKVVAEEVPVKAVVPSAKAFTISTGNTFAFGYSLTPAKAGMTVSNPVVKWTVSDPSLMAFVDPSTGETTETAQTYGMEDTVYLQALGTRTGKVTVTGTAMDGSKKTVKVTVNICAGNSTDLLSYFDLSTPANTPNDGVDGQAVLTWGKSMQLKATYTPRKAKNVTLIWDVVGIDVETGEEILNPAGITVKNGKVTVAKATASLTPFTGVIRVTARTAQQYYDGSEYYSFERSQEILVKAPLTSVKLTAPATLYPGATAQIVPQLGLAAGATAEDYPLLWTVNDAKLAEIDSEGNLTIKDTAPIGKSVKVTAQTLDGTGKKATVTVKIANS